MKKKAVISECGKYRYSLGREWDPAKPKVLFIMLNPSKADADTDDPTIRRCISFAQSWGFGGLLVGNIFAYRATGPGKLKTCTEPAGPENLNHISELAQEAELIILAWGNADTLKFLKRLYPSYFVSFFLMLGLFGSHKSKVLQQAKDGTPWHPLYMAASRQPIEFDREIINKYIE